MVCGLVGCLRLLSGSCAAVGGMCAWRWGGAVTVAAGSGVLLWYGTSCGMMYYCITLHYRTLRMYHTISSEKKTTRKYRYTTDGYWRSPALPARRAAGLETAMGGAPGELGWER